MTVPELLSELTRVIAYGGGGFLLGYVVCLWAGDRHRVITEVLDEAERDVPTKRRKLNPQSVNNFIVILIMAMMLLTGVVWLQNELDNAAQDKRECLRAVAVTEALRARTNNYLESAESEQELWRDLRAALRRLDEDGDSPITASVQRHIANHRSYINHLRDNPVPKASTKDC